DLDIDGRKKMELVSDCGEAEFRMSEGSDEYIQLEALLSRFVLAGSEK
ncbi:MAG: Replication factor C small subunit, partial [Nanoarchaeota archaeon]|nr:Replication factor C small subunit [Nanoarchaeota archaeon]